MNRQKATLAPTVDGLERREVLSAVHHPAAHIANAGGMNRGGPIRVHSGIGPFLSSLGIPSQTSTTRFAAGPFSGGTPNQFFGTGGLGPGLSFVPVATFGGNVPGASSGNGSGGRGGISSFRFNPVRDFSAGGQTVVVGLQGPGIGNFTRDLSIQFRQNSAQAIRPFNAVPGAETTFGPVIVTDRLIFGF